MWRSACAVDGIITGMMIDILEGVETQSRGCGLLARGQVTINLELLKLTAARSMPS